MDQKVVLFIGVCDDICISSIIEFTKFGYRIAVASQDVSKVQDALDLCKDEPQVSNKSNYFIKTANFKDPKDAGQTIRETVESFGRIDTLVINSSQIGQDRKLNDREFFDDFRDVLQMNLMFATRIAQLAEPYLIQSKGNIIIVSIVDEQSLSYRVAQAGLLMLNKTLANSFMHKEVRVNAIVDPLVGESYSQVAYKEIQEPGNKDLSDELVRFIIFLSSDEASYVNGSIFKVLRRTKVQNI